MSEFLPRNEHNEYAKRMEDEHRRQNHRITTLEEEVKALRDLAASVKDLAENMKGMLIEQQKQGDRLDKLEKAPLENWRTVLRGALTSIGSALAGALIAGAVFFLTK